MKQYKYILFDWDGTIAKTLDIWLNALSAVTVNHGHNLTDKQIGADFNLFRQRYSHLGNEVVDAIINEALEISNQKIQYVELYSHQFDVLNQLYNAKKILGIVTTSRHQVIDPLLDKFVMKELFEVVVCGDDVTKHKPDKEPILKAMQELSATIAETLFVGDSDKDIISAQKAGIDSVLFYPPEHHRFHDITHLNTLRPTYVIKSFRELISIVN